MYLRLERIKRIRSCRNKTTFDVVSVIVPSWLFWSSFIELSLKFSVFFFSFEGERDMLSSVVVVHGASPNETWREWHAMSQGAGREGRDASRPATENILFSSCLSFSWVPLLRYQWVKYLHLVTCSTLQYFNIFICGTVEKKAAGWCLCLDIAPLFALIPGLHCCM